MKELSLSNSAKTYIIICIPPFCLASFTDDTAMLAIVETIEEATEKVKRATIIINKLKTKFTSTLLIQQKITVS